MEELCIGLFKFLGPLPDLFLEAVLDLDHLVLIVSQGLNHLIEGLREFL